MWLPKLALALAATLQALQGVPVAEEQTNVPPDVVVLMTKAKLELRDLASEVIKSQPANTNAAKVKRAIQEQLPVATQGEYGDVWVEVSEPEEHPDLLAVQFTFAVPCGEDSALFLFRRGELVYERSENGWDKISGALGGFQWKLSPVDAHGRFLVMSSTIAPWCVSNWHDMRYWVDRVEEHRVVPIFAGHDGIFERNVELTVERDAFSIAYTGYNPDPDYVTQSYELHYVVVDDRAVQVEEVGDTKQYELPEAAALARTVTALQGIAVAEDDTDVPSDARLLLTNTKLALRDLAAAAVASHSQSAGEVQRAIGANLPPTASQRYGDLSVAVDTPAENLLAIEFEITVPCGSDTVLFLFRDKHLVYTRSEDGYESIDRALGTFQWKVSPPDANGRFLIVTSSITPGCASSWHELRYRVDRVERDGVTNIDQGEFTSYQWEVKLQATPDSYAIDFDGDCIDPSRNVRTHNMHFTLDGDHPVRVDPIAGDPRGFVEELYSMRDQNVRRWSDVDTQDWPSVTEEGSSEYGPMTRCSNGDWQVRIDHSPPAETDEYVSWYYMVSESNGVYRLLAISDSPRADCEESSDTIAGSE